MKENLIEPERIRAIQEALCGFLLDEVINPNGEFYSDPMNAARRMPVPMTMQMIRIFEEFVLKKTYENSYL